MKFKHSLIVTGSIEQIKLFRAELEKIGYKVNRSYDYAKDKATILGINKIGPDYPNGIKNGEYGTSTLPSASAYNKREFEFDISSQKEFNKALAIAAITTEDECTIGEYWRYINTNSLWKVLDKKSQGTYIEPIRAYSTQPFWYSVLKLVESEKKWRRLTAEEIIKHFDKQETPTYIVGIDPYRVDEETIKSTTMTNKFKVGDKVKILKSTHGGELVVGSVGTIENVSPTDYGVRGTPKKGHTTTKWWYTEEELELVSSEEKKPIGYKVIKEYPGSEKLGEIFPPNYKKYVDFPEFYEPIYESEYKEITIGTNNDVIRIGKEKILFQSGSSGIEIDVKNIRDILIVFSNSIVNHLSFAGFAPSIDAEARFIRIGCLDENHRFSIQELRKVLTIYSDLNI